MLPAIQGIRIERLLNNPRLMILPVFTLFILFSVLFGTSKHEQNVKKLGFALFFFCLMLTLIAVFRPFDMPDRENYIGYWNGWGGERFEIGFTVVTDTVRKISDGEYWFLFVFSALSIGLKILALARMSSLVWASLLIYVANIFILHDMIQMRCAVASGLLLWAVYYLVNRNSMRFISISILAFLFHYSAIIIFPLWFLNVNRSYKYFYIVLIVVAYIIRGNFPIADLIQYFPIEGIQNLWEMYEYSYGNEINVFNSMQLGRVCLCGLLFFYIDEISRYNKYAILLLKIYALSIVAYVLFSSVPVMTFRISEFYQVVEILIIPMIVYVFKGRKFLKYALVLAFGLSLLLMNIYYLKILK